MGLALEGPDTRERGSGSRGGAAARAATRSALDAENRGCSSPGGASAASQGRGRAQRAPHGAEGPRRRSRPKTCRRSRLRFNPRQSHSLTGANHRQASRHRVTLSGTRLSRYRSVETRGPHHRMIERVSRSGARVRIRGGGCNPATGLRRSANRAPGVSLPGGCGRIDDPAQCPFSTDPPETSG